MYIRKLEKHTKHHGIKSIFVVQYYLAKNSLKLENPTTQIESILMYMTHNIYSNIFSRIKQYVFLRCYYSFIKPELYISSQLLSQVCTGEEKNIYIRKIKELIKYHEIKLVYLYNTKNLLNNSLKITKSNQPKLFIHQYKPLIPLNVYNNKLNSCSLYTFYICVYTPILKQQFRKRRSPTLIIIIR